MNSPDIKEFIHKHRNLFWYINEEEKEQMSLAVVVETILNYGNLESVKKLFEIIGIKKVSEIFKVQINNERNNYFLPVKNFFELYFKRHV